MEPELPFFASTLRACGSLTALKHGRQIHELIVRTGSEFDVFVGSSLVDMGTLMMHAKCLIICQTEMLSPELR
jgi:hypothetical protein